MLSFFWYVLMERDESDIDPSGNDFRKVNMYILRSCKIERKYYEGSGNMEGQKWKRFYPTREQKGSQRRSF